MCISWSNLVSFDSWRCTVIIMWNLNVVLCNKCNVVVCRPTWSNIIKTLHGSIKDIHTRNIDILQRMRISNNYLLSTIWYIAQLLPLPARQAQHITTIILGQLWKVLCPQTRPVERWEGICLAELILNDNPFIKILNIIF